MDLNPSPGTPGPPGTGATTAAADPEPTQAVPVEPATTQASAVDPGTGPVVIPTAPTLQGRYQLKEVLGRGGMGDVYAATDQRLGREVAVKVLAPAAARIPGSRERFEREARLAAGLSHPNVVSVFDTGEDGGTAFIVMELVTGGTLSERLRTGPLSPYEAVEMAEDLLSALSAAHEQELLHRDVKPGNVLVNPDGQWKVADFGIAKTLSSDAALTSTGLVVGTAAYLAPEILSGRSASVRSDLWAAAAVLYEALCGERPYAFAPEHANSLTVPLVPLASRAPHLPAALCSIVDRGLSIDPYARFDSATDMLAALQQVKPFISPVDGPTQVIPLPTAPAPATLPPFVPVPSQVEVEELAPGAPVPAQVPPAARAIFVILVLLLMAAAAFLGFYVTST